MSRRSETKDKLIRAGITELRERGVAELSIRKAAAACGVSCAAPYRHFKNKDEFILGIYKYIKRRWTTEQNVIISEYSTTKERLIEISISYIRFLCENPEYYAIIIRQDDDLNEEQTREKIGMTELTEVLINQYCRETGQTQKETENEVAEVRSLIYGYALMILCRELPDNEKTYDIIRSSIEKRFR